MMSVTCHSKSLLNTLIAGIVFLALPACLHAQGGLSAAQGQSLTAGRSDDPTDLILIRDQHFSDAGEFAHYHGAGNNEQVLQNRHHNVIAQYNPVSLVLKGVLLGYQKLVSEQLARSCPYEITCSNFSKQAIQEFGILKGVFISADRILRCNRIGLLDVSPLSIDPATGRIIDPPNLYR